MTSKQNPATGTVTGVIPDTPPTCFACGDEFADMIDIRAETGDAPQWLCRDRVPCMERSTKREAAKNNMAAVPDAAQDDAVPFGTETEPAS